MGMSAYPLSSSDPTSLKLVVAAKLPPSNPAPPKTDAVSGEKKVLHSKASELSEAALAEISRLKARDIQVHQHEQAHLSAAAGLDVSNASFTYQRGPNGVNYAVAGEVKIDTTPGRTPEETLARAEMISQAALAPADPSPVDRSVAAKAQHMAQQARTEIVQQEIKHAIQQADQQAEVSHAYDGNSQASKTINTYA